jgi:heterodisulfide reductase subunit D
MTGEKSGDKVYPSIKGLTRLQMIYLDTCTRCSLCAEYCPTYQEGKDPRLIPGEKHSYSRRLVKSQKGLLRGILGPKALDEKELRERADLLYQCTLCGRCGFICPHDMDVYSLWPTMRRVTYENGLTPEPLSVIRENLKASGNPYGLEREMRTYWLKRAKLEKPPLVDGADIIYFVGCTTAFKSTNRGIPQAVAQILDQAGDNWSILGEDEMCCGSPWIMVGGEEEARTYAEKNVEMIEAGGASTLLVSCASCYRTFRWEYPKLLGRQLKFKVRHVVDLFNQYIEDGVLKPERSSLRVIYHDPCELSRLGGVIKEPRRIIEHLTTNMLEYPERGMDTRCCGGGGLLQVVNNDMRLGIASKRVAQALKLGAEIIVSACPACKTTLQEAAKASQSRIEVLDIMELLGKQLL